MKHRVCRNCRDLVSCDEASNLNRPLLWFLYTLSIVPGIVYHLTRVSYLKCSRCQSQALVPLDSKVAKKILRSTRYALSMGKRYGRSS